jgi:hypothetical protein
LLSRYIGPAGWYGPPTSVGLILFAWLARNSPWIAAGFAVFALFIIYYWVIEFLELRWGSALNSARIAGLPLMVAPFVLFVVGFIAGD